MQRKDFVRGACIGCLVSLCVTAANAEQRDSSSPAAVKTADAGAIGAPKPAQLSVEKRSKPVIQGTVVDETDTPVPNVEVLPSRVGESRTDLTVRTDAAGKFTLTLPFPNSYHQLNALDKAQSRLGFYPLFGATTAKPPRIKLIQGRSIPVIVVDAKNRPVAGAKLGVTFQSPSVLRRYPAQEVPQPLTDAAGKSVLLVPNRPDLACVFAVKKGVGFDYFIYREPGEAVEHSHKRASDVSVPIQFVLRGVRKTLVHVVDEQRKPLPGVRVLASFVQRQNKGGPAVSAAVDEFQVVTDRAGIAEFDSIPIDAWPTLEFESKSMSCKFHERTRVDPADAKTELTAVAEQLPALRVQVKYLDGRPALGALVHWECRFFGREGGFSGTWDYGSEGVQDLYAFGDDAYCVVRAALDHDVSTVAACVARVGKPMRPVHLVLRPGVRVHGTLTVGKENRPAAAKEPVTLIELDEGNYAKLPKDERLPGIRQTALDVPYYKVTDAQGRFEFYAAPGSYLIGPGSVFLNQRVKTDNVKTLFNEGAQEVQLKDQAEIEVNLHREHPSPPRRNRRNMPSLKAPLR